MSAVPTIPLLPARASAAPNRLAVVHMRGGVAHVLIAQGLAGGVNVLDTRVVNTDPAAALRDLVKRHRVETIVRVAPSTQVVARALTLPRAPDTETEAALRLQLETQVAETIPAHRKVAGLMPSGARAAGATRIGLLTAWMPTGHAAKPFELGVPERWTTEVAALGALGGERPGISVCVAREERVCSIIAIGPERAAARVLMLDADAPGNHGIAQVITETGGAVGIGAETTPPLPEGEGRLLLPPASRQAIEAGLEAGARAPGWLDQFGIALGAALLATSDSALTRSLTDLTPAPPAHARVIWRSAVEWLSSPVRAGAVLAASLVVLLAAPWALAAARVAVLESKSDGLESFNKKKAEAAQQAALHRQLETTRWPMTKLLADVSGATPVGITLDSVRLAPDQGLSVQGHADNGPLVDVFQANLAATRLFANVKINRFESTASVVEFDLSADVTSPHSKAAKTEDFAAKPLAVRLYGEGASNTQPPVAAPSQPSSSGSRRAARAADSEPADSPSRSERVESRRGEGPGPERPARPTATGAAAPSGEVPPPLTDEQIKAMNSATAMREWVSRRTYPQKNPTVDAATKSRLEEEVRKLADHREKLKTAGGGGGT